ncbi:MAG: DUF4396 domain-containing protein [Caulobacteraceae bacterium]|nr:DUF4396 domain-containing protein [Caulobacteraceae bacterium]
MSQPHDPHAHQHSHPAPKQAGAAAAAEANAKGQSLNRVAFTATLHCLTGCAIGEVLGMALGAAFHWPNLQTIIVAVVLAFFFGYALTMLPLIKAGLAFGQVLKLALAADTISITIMEIIDNLIMLVIPGAMDAHIDQPLFWGSLTFALLLAGAVAFPINRWLISRGRGHAVVHAHHRDH